MIWEGMQPESVIIIDRFKKDVLHLKRFSPAKSLNMHVRT